MEGYDFVLLDCPPAVGLITVNALVAATDLIIPVQPEVASLYVWFPSWIRLL